MKRELSSDSDRKKGDDVIFHRVGKEKRFETVNVFFRLQLHNTPYKLIKIVIEVNILRTLLIFCNAKAKHK